MLLLAMSPEEIMKALDEEGTLTNPYFCVKCEDPHPHKKLELWAGSYFVIITKCVGCANVNVNGHYYC